LSVEHFFQTIGNGAWHTVDELAAQFKIPTQKLTRFLQVLAEHGVITYDTTTHRMRLHPTWTRLLPENALE